MKAGRAVSKVKQSPGEPPEWEAEAARAPSQEGLGAPPDPRISAQPGGGGSRGRRPRGARRRPGQRRRSTPSSSGTPRPGSATPGRPSW